MVKHKGYYSLLHMIEKRKKNFFLPNTVLDLCHLTEIYLFVVSNIQISSHKSAHVQRTAVQLCVHSAV